jgi:hypothetical protein
MIGSVGPVNNNSSSNNSNNSNNNQKSRFQRDTPASEELENTSVCSSLSSMTDHDDDDNGDSEVPVQVTTTEKKSKFTITKATARPNSPSYSSPVLDAVSISFLGPITPETSQRTTPGQVIQKALAGLRPGGIFFVLDYQDDSQVAGTGISMGSTSITPEASGSASNACCSLAVKEIPQDLVQQWNLTMVPTNLESFYNAKPKQSTAKPPPTTKVPSLVPASRRIVRWMGIKPRVSPKE